MKRLPARATKAKPPDGGAQPTHKPWAVEVMDGLSTYPCATRAEARKLQRLIRAEDEGNTLNEFTPKQNPHVVRNPLREAQ